MADYVHKNILSEAYVHIDMVELDSTQKQKFENQLMLFTESRGRFAIYEEITPEIRTKDGSLKVYSSITGTLSEALGNYPTFEEALNNLYIDAKRLAEAMILETLFLAKARGQKVLRREARTGIIRSTKELFDHIDLARNESEEDSPKAGIRKIVTIRLKIEALLKVLSSDADKALIKKEVKEKMNYMRTPKRIRESSLQSDISSYEAEKKRIKQIVA